MQTPLKGRSQKIIVGGAAAQRISYQNGAPEGATDLIDLVEIPRGDRLLLFDIRYGLSGCSNVNKAFRDECEAENRKTASRAAQIIEEILSSVTFN